MVEVCKIPDKAPVNQQLQPLLGQPQNVHGIPADEIGNLIQPNGRTVGIDAVEHFPPVVIAQFQGLAAAAAGGGEHIAGGTGEIVSDHGDNLVGFDDGDGVPQPQFQLFDDADVIQGGAGDGGAVNFHRVKNRNRVHLPGAVGAPFNVPQHGFVPILVKFECQGVLGVMPGAAQAQAVGHIVERANQTVNGEALGGAILLQRFHFRFQGIPAAGFVWIAIFQTDMGHHLKAQLFQQGEGGRIGFGIVQGASRFVGGGIELPGDELHPPLGGNPAVQLAYRAADQVAGVFVFRLLLLVDAAEGGIVNDALAVHNQLPLEGNLLGQIAEGAGGVGDVLAHFAVAPAFGAAQYPVPIDHGGGQTVHFGHEVHGLSLKIIAELLEIGGFSQGKQGVIVGNLLQLAHRLVAHGGGGGIGIDDAGLLLQRCQLVKEGIVLLVGDKAFVFVIISVPVGVQLVYQKLHLVHLDSSWYRKIGNLSRNCRLLAWSRIRESNPPLWLGKRPFYQ